VSTEHIVAAILFCIVIVVPALVFVLDDGKWERKKKGESEPR
jgi:hypothetical protein